MNTLHDNIAEAAISESKNMLVPWYLIASYAYYEMDHPVVSDGLYDRICFLLGEYLDMLEIEHVHTPLCDPEALAAGTGYQIQEYPSVVVSVAKGFVEGVYPS